MTDRETGDLFREKLAAVDKMLQDENYPSPEEIELIAAELDSLYECVWNSENLFQLEQKGYYRIIANKDYYKTIETGGSDSHALGSLPRAASRRSGRGWQRHYREGDRHCEESVWKARRLRWLAHL